MSEHNVFFNSHTQVTQVSKCKFAGNTKRETNELKKIIKFNQSIIKASYVKATYGSKLNKREFLEERRNNNQIR